MTRSYEIVSQDKKRQATLIVGPVAQPGLFVGIVAYFDEDGEMRCSPFLDSTTSVDDAKAKATAWIKKNLFPVFTEKFRREW